jgi:transcriptional regulator GlxA family with amidase domain
MVFPISTDKISGIVRKTPVHNGTSAARDFSASPLSVGIVLWPSFPIMSLAGLVESLRHAGDHGDASHQRYARWEILGAPGSRAVSSCGIPVESTSPYTNPNDFDFVFVIGGLLRDLAIAPRQHRDFIRAAGRADTVVVGVCTGSFVLVEEGLLDGKPVCVHPYHQKDFETAFPGHRTVFDRDFITAGNTVTVMGGVSMLSLTADIIDKHLGPDRSAKMVHQMTLPSRRIVGPSHWKPMSQDQKITDPRIQRALVTLDAQATQNPSIAQLARSVGLSERHFLRLFRDQVGRSPKDYLVDTKLRAAVWMLRHSTRSITSIAYTAGFSSGANLADHCQKRLSATPSQIRRAAETPVFPSPDLD